MMPLGAAAVGNGGLATNNPATGPLFTKGAQKVPFVLVVSVSPGHDVAPAVRVPVQIVPALVVVSVSVAPGETPFVPLL
jgi:hypothetical protein